LDRSGHVDHAANKRPCHYLVLTINSPRPHCISRHFHLDSRVAPPSIRSPTPSLKVTMASFSLQSYSTSKSSGGREALTSHRVVAEQVIGPIGGTSSNSRFSDSTSESTESEKVRLEKLVIENRG